MDLTIVSGETLELSLETGAGVDVSIPLTGVQGPPGPGVPSGGTTDQALFKASDGDYHTEWRAINLRDLSLPPFDSVALVYSGGQLVAASYPGGTFYDYVSLTYSGSVLSKADYKLGGEAGELVATYVLSYSGDTATGVNRTL